ncbi:MAG: 3-isopropylmalate/(R)-2-methylmalate dehydratase small subunit [Flavobacteriaceae bacterium]|jgi:3-isopropylmalate/(R)-2-methylmalate dehydratase small subunit
MKKIESTGIVLNIDNIDTDQIIPAKFLKSTTREGFGEKLFYNWRYDEDNNPKIGFAFNEYQVGSEILIAGNNFGCGSSREHAAWAIADYGIKGIISSQFADIFETNALNNGILPVRVSPACLAAITKYVQHEKKCPIHVDVQKQQLIIDAKDIYINVKFEIDALKKKFLISGTSELEYLVNQEEDVNAYEQARF